MAITCDHLHLLKERVEVPRIPSRQLDQILIANSRSTDRTKRWLDSQPDLQVIHQENPGGAGSFHAAVKHAAENNADYVWAMDDDVPVKPEALHKLPCARQDLNCFDHSDLRRNATSPCRRPTDRFFGYTQGERDWRTVQFTRSIGRIAEHQRCPAPNCFDADVLHTGIHEFKPYHLEQVEMRNLDVFREPSQVRHRTEIPFAPVNARRNITLSKQYLQEAKCHDDISCGIRLSTRCCLEMNDTVETVPQTSIHISKEL